MKTQAVLRDCQGKNSTKVLLHTVKTALIIRVIIKNTTEVAYGILQSNV